MEDTPDFGNSYNRLPIEEALMRIHRVRTGAGGVGRAGSDEFVIVCCVSAGGLAATGLTLLGPPSAMTLGLIAAATGIGLALWATAEMA